MTCVLSGCKCGGTFDERHTDRIRAVTVAPSSAVPLESMIEELAPICVTKRIRVYGEAVYRAMSGSERTREFRTAGEAVAALYRRMEGARE